MWGHPVTREPIAPTTFRPMDTLRAFAPQILALLAGGLSSSLGLTWLLRRERARERLLGMRVWAIGLACAVLLLVGIGGATWLVRSTLAGGEIAASSLTPLRLLLFGFLVGMPLSLPGVLFAWSEARTRDRAQRRRKDFVPTKDDRRRFADDLVRQIQELSPTPRRLSASIGGDGGRVLVLEGEIDAQEGERLTAALRADLESLGFKRVEGRHGSKTWWSRVHGGDDTEAR